MHRAIMNRALGPWWCAQWVRNLENRRVRCRGKEEEAEEEEIVTSRKRDFSCFLLLLTALDKAEGYS